MARPVTRPVARPVTKYVMRSLGPHNCAPHWLRGDSPAAEKRGDTRRASALGRLRSQLWLAIVAATFAFSAIIPTGHMVAIGADLSVEIVPCPSKNALARAFQSDSAHHAGSSGDHPDHHQGTTAGDDGAGENSSNADCDLGTSGFGGPVSDTDDLATVEREQSASPLPALPALALSERKNLRPPLRAPPFKS